MSGEDRTFLIDKLHHPIMIAAGMVKSLEDARIAVRQNPAALVAGSFTVDSKPGNPTPNDFLGINPHSGRVLYSLNSLGLPNPGIDEAELEGMKALAERESIPFIVSVAGLTSQEYLEMTRKAFDRGADVVELNLGCPNVWEGGQQKGIASYSPEVVDDILAQVCVEFWGVGIKISPLANPDLVKAVARVLLKYSPSLAYVASCNTYPNGFVWAPDRERPAIGVGAGLAGVAGFVLKPMSLGQVVQLREVLADKIPIVGVGGISSVADVQDYLRAGASAVQVATYYYEHPANLGRLVSSWAYFS